VLGESAGGNLATAVTTAARDENLPPSSCVAVISPFADLTFSGPSLELRKNIDPFVTRGMLESMASEYLDGADPADPGCSAVFTDLPAPARWWVVARASRRSSAPSQPVKSSPGIT
jgi:epsilon-lactone hydrolase